MIKFYLKLVSQIYFILIYLKILLGSIGTTFYIILKGSVSILVRIPVTNDKGVIVDFILKNVGTLGTGSSFGELGIMEDLKPRAATIVAKDSCHLAVLGRATYKKCLGLHQKKELDSKIEFLSTIPLFKSWSKQALMKLTYIMNIKTYIMRQVIYMEDNLGDDIYIIRTGEVKSTKNIEISYSPEEADQLILDNKQHMYSYKKEPFSKTINLAILSVGEIFGEEEAYNSYRKEKIFDKLTKRSNDKDVVIDKKFKENILRHTTMTCSSLKAEIWCFPKKTFFAKLEPYASSLTMLTSIIKKKTMWTQNRIEEIKKSSISHMNFLVGNCPIKAKSTENNDMVTTIKYKYYSKNKAQPIIKNNPLEAQSQNLSFEIKEKILIPVNKSLETKYLSENDENSRILSQDIRSIEDKTDMINKLKQNSKKISANTATKYQDLKLGISNNYGITKENLSIINKRLRGLNTTSVYHDLQGLLSSKIVTNNKLQDKPKESTFCNTESYYNSIHENDKMITVLKSPGKTRSTSVHTKKEDADDNAFDIFKKRKRISSYAQREDNSEEYKSLSRVVCMLKSRSRFNKYEENLGSLINNSTKTLDSLPLAHDDQFSKTFTNFFALNNRTPKVMGTNLTLTGTSFTNTQSSNLNDSYDITNKRSQTAQKQRSQSPKNNKSNYLSDSKDCDEKSYSPFIRSKLFKKALIGNSKPKHPRIVLDVGGKKLAAKTLDFTIHSFNL